MWKAYQDGLILINPEKTGPVLKPRLFHATREVSGHHDRGTIAPGPRSMGTDGADAEPFCLPLVRPLSAKEKRPVNEHGPLS